jgi:hypothetical protein
MPANLNKGRIRAGNSSLDKSGQPAACLIPAVRDLDDISGRSG